MKKLFLLSIYFIGSIHGMAPKLIDALKFVKIRGRIARNVGRVGGPYSAWNCNFLVVQPCREFFKFDDPLQGAGKKEIEKGYWHPAIERYITKYKPLYENYPNYRNGKVFSCLISAHTETGWSEDMVFDEELGPCPIMPLIHSYDVAKEEQAYLEMIDQGKLKEYLENTKL